MKKTCILLSVVLLAASLFGCTKPQITINEDYQGPNFPLSFVAETEGIIAEREITVDYSDYKYPTTEGQDGNRKVKINDKYVLTNITNEDIAAELAYGFVGDYSTDLSMISQIKIDGTLVDSELVFGRSPLRYGVDLKNREGYEQLLEGGTYRDEAFDSVANVPVFSENAHVYRIKSVAYGEKNKNSQLPYGRISFTFDSAKTEVYSWGFNECKEENGSVIMGFSVPTIGTDGFGNDKYLIAVGDELQINNIKYYKNSNSMQEIDNFTLEVEEYDCSFDEILEEVVVDKKDDAKVLTWGTNYIYSKLKTEQILTVGKQYIADMRELNIETEYPVLDLESYMFNMYGDSRVSYQTLQTIIPANRSIELSFEYEKYTGIKIIDGIGYDGLEIMTTLGTNIEFRNQMLKVVGLDHSIISEHTSDEKIKKGQYEVAMTEDYYSIYLETAGK
ncbi:MAG: hypothetical protein IJZ53_04080 [Tyzzerella sp.]|nr:hypothetical protein [Tyzzerella sp.]